MTDLVRLNPDLDPRSLAAEFAGNGMLQVRNVLAPESAAALQRVLIEETPWGLAYQEGSSSPPAMLRAEDLERMTPGERAALSIRPGAGEDYAFAYHSYPLVTAYLQGWRPGSPQEILLEELNSPAILDFMKSVSGMPDIMKMDGQATLYAPGHFLWPHSDAESERGRRVAYVLNLTLGEWRPQWGGYLNFFDEQWDVTHAFKPRFNCLNLFRVPQWHSVSEVAAEAPLARYAITGWARDR